MADGDGWGEWREFVLRDLERLSGEVKDVKGDVGDVRKDTIFIRESMAGMKVKLGFLATFFGILGGVLAALLKQM